MQYYVFFLVKSPKRSGDAYCLCSVSSSSSSSSSSSFTPKFCLVQLSIANGQIALKFWDMLEMDVQLCNRVWYLIVSIPDLCTLTYF